MHTTPISLLERLRQTPEPAAWNRFVTLYTPLLYYWARRAGASEQDAADLVQEIFLVLLEKLPHFHYDPAKSFRGWLRAVTLNKWRDHLRHVEALPRAGKAELAELADAAAPDAFAEAEYRRYLVARALRLMQTDFAATTWKACWQHKVLGRPAREVAAELGISENAVYVHSSKVINRLRSELEGLWE
jgi:RNA polymerase sigma-70 factor (ECF subfamily)